MLSMALIFRLYCAVDIRLATEDCFFYTIWSIYGRFLKQTQLIVLDYIHQETITSGYQKWHVHILDSRSQQPHQYCIPAKENAISVNQKWLCDSLYGSRPWTRNCNETNRNLEELSSECLGVSEWDTYKNIKSNPLPLL